MNVSFNNVNFSTNSFQRSTTLPRPDADQMAADLLNRLDSSSKGYVELADLQAALNESSATEASSNSDASALFAALDSDSDGKVNQQELSDSLRKLGEQLEMQLRQTGGSHRMPPSSPPTDDAGFTKEELESQLQEIGSSDSKRSELISAILEDFNSADSDGDGRVNFREAMAFNEAKSSSSGTPTASTDTGDTNDKLMRTLLQLLHSYGRTAEADSTGTLSITA